ncbi:MAG: hypothetical protein KDB00_21800 [Planctomycetales bacterium]|nr:hypothetical protein [Planctomycetales bacterium]
MLRHLTPSQTFVVRLLFVSVVLCLPASIASAWEPKSKAVVSGKESLDLNSPGLLESSGLAFSHVDADCLWSHNDSGGRARLHSFNHLGRPTGRADLKGIKATDWEDMSSFVDTVPRLLVADVGDNDAERKSVSIYIFDEPNPKKKSTINVFEHLVIHYPGGAQNCEAVAVDVKNRRILMLEKSPLIATMYQVDLPKRVEADPTKDHVTKIEVEAMPIQKVAIPLATGMDLCPKTGDLWISNYLQVFCYPYTRKLPLESRLRQVPRMLDLPSLRQVEAVAIDEKGRVWVTSEGKPAKLQRVVDEKQ